MKIVLSGGGTGGHIYPALALRNEILKKYPHAEFLYIGTEKGLENQIVTALNIPFEAIKVQGIRRSLSIENLKTAWYVLTSVGHAKKLLKQFNPDVVIGTGGYVCGPVLYAATKLKIPTIIHEQNSVAGVTNKLLSRYVTKIATCFETVNRDFEKFADKIVLTGNPRGQELVANQFNPNILNQFGLDSTKPAVLIFGGSRGAANLNQHVVEHLEQYRQMQAQFLFVTGKAHYDKVVSEIGEIPNNFKILPYLNEMMDVLNVVDLVVCRSGATTLSELTALGVASVLIPSPFVTNNHQEKNARALVDQNAAEIVLETELKTEKLYHIIYDLIQDKSKRDNMAMRAKKLGIIDASDRLIQLIEEII